MTSTLDRTLKLGILLSVIDWVTFNIVYFINIVSDRHVFPDNRDSAVMEFLISNISYIIALQLVTISLHHRLSQLANILKNTSRTSVIFIVLYTAILGMAGAKTPDFTGAIWMTAMIFLFTTIERLLLRTFIMYKRNTGSDRVNTVILGRGGMTQKAIDVMTDTWNGYNLLGYFNEAKDENLKNKFTGEGIPYLGTKDEIAPFLENHHINELYICLSQDEMNDETGKLIILCERKMIRTYYIPTVVCKEFRNAKAKEFGDIYIISQYNEPLLDIRKRICKRTFDITASLLFICTLFPFILLAVAVISRVTMPGPLFFRQKRTGYNGKDFYCYKFRSMKINKDSDNVQVVKGDPRITKWGQFMRHTNIDELPQFINVLKGDMSVVGPRPHMLAHTGYYSGLISDYMIRHYIKPGITGWAQTHGERGETKTVEDMRRRVEKDIWYIEHWSFWLDIQIIFKTISNTVCGDEKAF